MPECSVTTDFLTECGVSGSSAWWSTWAQCMEAIMSRMFVAQRTNGPMSVTVLSLRRLQTGSQKWRSEQSTKLCLSYLIKPLPLIPSLSSKHHPYVVAMYKSSPKCRNINSSAALVTETTYSPKAIRLTSSILSSLILPRRFCCSMYAAMHRRAFSLQNAQTARQKATQHDRRRSISTI